MKAKRLLVILLTIALAFSFGISAMAALGDGTGSITVNKVAAETDLSVYQILTYDRDSTAGNFHNIAFANPGYKDVFVSTINDPTITSASTVADIMLFITNNRQTDAFAKALGEALETYIGTAIAPYVTTADTTHYSYANGAGVFSGIELGYYLILDKTVYSEDVNATVLVMLQPMNENIVVTLKTDTYPEIVKEADDSTYAIGDEITYTITLPVPQTTKDNSSIAAYTVTDELGVGADFDKATGVTSVELGGAAIAYGVDATANSNGTTTIVFTFDMTDDDVKAAFTAAIGKDLVITYVATVNADAGDDGIINEVEENDYFGDPRYDDETVYTFGFKVIKTNEDDEVLPGVKFIVYQEDANDIKTYFKFAEYEEGDDHYGTYDYYFVGTTLSEDEATVLVTDAAGLIKVWGLDIGEYWLEEIEPLPGYNALPDAVAFEIEALSGEVTTVTLTPIEIENTTGIVLPGTGGIGTAIFTLTGALSVSGAAAFLTLNKKRIFGK